MFNSLFHRPFRTMVPGAWVLGIVLLAFASSGCMARHPAGIAPSTSPLPSSYTVLGPVEASSCKWVVLFLPVSGKSTTDEIIGQLVQSKGGTALIGVTVEHQVTQYPFVGSDCSVVKGLAVKGVRS